MHDHDEWQDGYAPIDGCFTKGFFLVGNELSSWEMVKNDEITVSGWDPVIRSLWRPTRKRANTLLSLDIIECESRSAALDQLLRSLGGFSLPIIGRQEPPPAGDVAFSNPDQTALLFNRGNLVVQIMNAEADLVKVAQVAHQFDTSISSPPSLSRSERRPSISPIEAATDTVEVGQRLGFRIRVTDPQRQRFYLKTLSTRGHVELAGNRMTYRPATAGVQRIVVYAVNEAGQASRSTLRITARKSS